MTPDNASSTSDDQTGTKTMNSAPNTAPATVARPPTTIAARNANDTVSVKDSGATKPWANVKSAPATPAYAALSPKARVLKVARLTPIVRAAVSSSRIAISARPTLRRTIPAANQNIGTATTSDRK